MHTCIIDICLFMHPPLKEYETLNEFETLNPKLREAM